MKCVHRRNPPDLSQVVAAGGFDPRMGGRFGEDYASNCKMRSFDFLVKCLQLPLRFAVELFKSKRQVLGGCFAGVVESVGADVARCLVGDKVFGAARLKLGAYGGHLLLPDDGPAALTRGVLIFSQTAP